MDEMIYFHLNIPFERVRQFTFYIIHHVDLAYYFMPDIIARYTQIFPATNDFKGCEWFMANTLGKDHGKGNSVMEYISVFVIKPRQSVWTLG